MPCKFCEDDDFIELCNDMDCRSKREDELEEKLVAADEKIRLLKRLWHEWLDTPFFETREEWKKWVSDLRPRVQVALKG